MTPSDAVIASAIAATVITVAVFVWWVVSTLDKARAQAHGAMLRAAGLEATNSMLAEQLESKDQTYARLFARYTHLARTAIAGLSDADLIAMAGGDPGIPPPPGLAAAVGDGLLDPYEDGGGARAGEAGPVPAADPRP